MLGGLTAAAAFFGVMLNFLYLFAGAVSTNPWLLLLGTLVILAGPNAGVFGVDRYLFKQIRNNADRVFHRNAALEAGADKSAGA